MRLSTAQALSDLTDLDPKIPGRRDLILELPPAETNMPRPCLITLDLSAQASYGKTLDPQQGWPACLRIRIRKFRTSSNEPGLPTLIEAHYTLESGAHLPGSIPAHFHCPSLAMYAWSPWKLISFLKYVFHSLIPTRNALPCAFLLNIFFSLCRLSWNSFFRPGCSRTHRDVLALPSECWD